MKYIILVFGFLCTTSSFAITDKEFEYTYYKLLTAYTEAQTNSHDIYRYSDSSEVSRLEDKLKIQAKRDCITWRAARDYAAYVIENFDQYEAAVKNNTPLFDNISRREWELALKETNRKLHNPKNECN
ncbi:hypothetical protein RFH42_16800 [Acinetobacter rudis]|uniref:hypothetical protein n=1 Tax=Acinetobacter rudis TaxID=632955 RepID=UPI00280F929B|nr:hypothetical protein [Acinetobacter rudis]MDQ8954604.1 hypothetical protein [Acinetobacter rudis]